MKKLFVAIAFLFAFEASAKNVEDIKKIETYLNNIKNISAEFVQNASNGSVAEGSIKISKPNKIKMEYAPPTDVLIVGDGDFIVYHDKELEQTTHINYEDVPASIILANDIKLDDENLKVVDFYKDAGTTSVELEYVKNPDVGAIKLVFSNSPLELKQWSVVDPQGIEVMVSLFEAQTDIKFEESTFKFFENNKKPKYKK